jgi:hypothetical protein
MLHAGIQSRFKHVRLLFNHVWIVAGHDENTGYALKCLVESGSVRQLGDGGLGVPAKNVARFVGVAYDANRCVTKARDAPDVRASLWLSRDPSLKLRRNLVKPLFCLLRSISIGSDLDLQFSKPTL